MFSIAQYICWKDNLQEIEIPVFVSLWKNLYNFTIFIYMTINSELQF